MHAFVVLGFVVFRKANRLAWGNVSEMFYFVSSGMQNHNAISTWQCGFYPCSGFVLLSAT